MLISGMSRANALSIFTAGVAAVTPGRFMPRFLQFNDDQLRIGDQTLFVDAGQRIVVIAAGKAAAAMALETEKILGERITKGLVVTKYDHGLPLRYFTTIEAAHPVPDENSVTAGKEVVSLLQDTDPNDVVLLLISGGASSLLADHPPGVSLEDLQQVFTLLLHCGAAIDEMNTVRKHLSRIKGGQLVRYTEAPVFSLVLSDVPGDDLSVIASGLTVADDSSFEDTSAVLEKYGLTEKLPEKAREWIERGLRFEIPDTPVTGDPVFDKVKNVLVATNDIALEAAAAKAREIGYRAKILSPPLAGDAETQAGRFVSELKDSPAGTCLLWGGEPTVVVKGSGKGGRNQQFALAALAVMQDKGFENTTVLSGGTDGTDGPTDAAGAISDVDVAYQSLQNNLNIQTYLDNNDAYTFFGQTGGLVITGPTQTNVMDIVIGLKD